MEKIKSQLYELEENLDDYLFYDREELKKEDSYVLGLREGEEKGREENQILMILTMVKNGATVEEIHKLTELSIEFIESIINAKDEDNK